MHQCVNHQVNTLAAEKLYQKIAEILAPTKQSLLYDVCCGTGTIGLTMASRVCKVRVGPPRRTRGMRCAGGG